MILFDKIFRISFLLIILFEVLSFLSYFYPPFNNLLFIIILLLTFFLTFYRLDYGLYILFAELFIGSKGYLFYFTYQDLTISIRIGLWLIVLSIWLSKSLIRSIKNKKLSLKAYLNYNFFSYFIILFILIFWGLVNGYLAKNNLPDIFFDFNGWLYFAILFPVYNIFFVEKNQDTKQNNFYFNNFLQIFTAAIAWICLKTFIVLYIFSHNIIILADLYRWLRLTGVGEITFIQNGFYRIFFQSHIFVLIGFFIFALLFLFKDKASNLELKTKPINILILISLIATLSVNLLNLSRSNWVGLISGLLIVLFLLIKNYHYKKILHSFGIFILLLCASVSLIAIIIKFPYPKTYSNISTAGLLSDRASQIANEAGAASRWALLPILSKRIWESPITGKGFGTTVTYITKDPRALANNSTGEFTTYTFEWGWLDIWLKLGLFGILIYIILILKIIFNIYIINKNFLNEFQIIQIGFGLGIFIIFIVSFFSPYLNHPLGIGYLILCAAIADKKKDI